ncbi:hypothetical protein MASR1M12_22320 [Erysipelotrichia bacterium]
MPDASGSAFRNKGVRPLLDAIVAYLPSPLGIPASIAFNQVTDEELTIAADPNLPLAAMAFRLRRCRISGKLVYTRVYAGTLNVGDQIL